MNIHDHENVIQQGRVNEAYVFEVGATPVRTIYATSNIEDITIGANKYVAMYIKRSGFSYNDNFEPLECVIEVSAKTVISELDIMTHLKDVSKLNTMKVTVSKYFDEDFVSGETFFVGYLRSYSISDGICSMKFVTLLDELNREIPNVKCQALCNNTLFDPVCGLASGSYVETLQISDLMASNTILVSAGFAAHPDSYYVGGTVRKDGGDILRLITFHNGDYIKINKKFYDLAVGDWVQILPGCDKDPATCLNKYSNLANFVGMPYIPLSDSVETSVTES